MMPLFPVDLSSEPVQRHRRKTGSGIQMALFFFLLMELILESVM